MLRGLFLLLLLLSLLKNNNNQNKQNYLNVVTTQIQNFTYDHIYHYHDDAADARNLWKTVKNLWETCEKSVRNLWKTFEKPLRNR